MTDYTVPPWIPAKPLLAVVGQGPGTDEWRRGRPFIGAEGQQLRSWLAIFDLDPDEDVMYTNVTDVYYPSDPSHVPKGKEATEGYERVKAELAMAPSLRCVVLLGGPASHLLFKGRMGEMNGRQGTIGVGSAAAEEPHSGTRSPLVVSAAAPPTSLPVLACYHPGYFWHSHGAKARAQAESEILSVLQRASDIVNGKSTEVELPEPEYVEEVVVR